jgi:hypothetical protein
MKTKVIIFLSGLIFGLMLGVVLVLKTLNI